MGSASAHRKLRLQVDPDDEGLVANGAPGKLRPHRRPAPHDPVNDDRFHAETVAFYEREHGVRLEGSDAQAVLIANREVMPRKDRTLPARLPLAHDVALMRTPGAFKPRSFVRQPNLLKHIKSPFVTVFSLDNQRLDDFQRGTSS